MYEEYGLAPEESAAPKKTKENMKEPNGFVCRNYGG